MLTFFILVLPLLIRNCFFFGPGLGLLDSHPVLYTLLRGDRGIEGAGRAMIGQSHPDLSGDGSVINLPSDPRLNLLHSPPGGKRCGTSFHRDLREGSLPHGAP